MTCASVSIVSDLHTTLAKLQEDTIAAQVNEEQIWRAESFVDALRGLRHARQLVEELQGMAAELDLEVMKQAAAQQGGAK